LVNTAASAVIGLVVGAVVVAIMHVLPFGKKAAH
jgi:predicted DNA repair protein MutK